MLAVVIGLAALFAGEQVEPLGELDRAFSPAAPAHSLCRPGWEPDVIQTQGIVSLLCTKDGWTVILNADGSFNLAEKAGKFEQVESRVPGW